MNGTNSSSTQASFRPRITTTTAVKRKVKNCCRNSASTLDMANCTRSMSLMMVESRVPVVCFWKNAAERRRHGVVEIVAQVGDHAETGVVHQVGTGVVEDSLEYRRRNQRKGDDGPGIVKMRGNRTAAGRWAGRYREW